MLERRRLSTLVGSPPPSEFETLRVSGRGEMGPLSGSASLRIESFRSQQHTPRRYDGTGAGARAASDAGVLLPLVSGTPSLGNGNYTSSHSFSQRLRRNNNGTSMIWYVDPKSTNGSLHFSRGPASANGVTGPSSEDLHSTDSRRGQNPLVAAEPMTLMNNVVEHVGRGCESIIEGTPTLLRRLRHPLCAAAAFFLFLLLSHLFALYQTYKTTEFLLGVRVWRNRQSLDVAASLTEQLMARKRLADELQLPYKQLPSAVVERILAEVKALDNARKRAIDHLYTDLSYPGPKSDIVFLVDEHIAYEERIKRLTKEELEWLSVASAMQKDIFRTHIEDEVWGEDFLLLRAANHAQRLAARKQRTHAQNATRGSHTPVSSHQDVFATLPERPDGTLGSRGQEDVLKALHRSHGDTKLQLGEAEEGWTLMDFLRNRVVAVVLIICLLILFLRMQ